MLTQAESDLQLLADCPPFCCLGAAHEDDILRLREPLIAGLSNPVAASTAPGGVAATIAIRLAQLGIQTTLVCLSPPAAVRKAIEGAGVVLRPIGRKKCTARYTAVLAPDGELDVGYADMDQYDRIGPEDLRSAWLPAAGAGPAGAAVCDANFSAQAIEHAAATARQAGWSCMAAGTSAAKVERLADIWWDVLTGNEAEIGTLAYKESAAPRPQLKTKWLGITRGPSDAQLAADDQLHDQRPPDVAVTNANGAGDAFAAVLFASAACGVEPRRALALATAAGAASAAGLWPLVGKNDECSLDNALRLMGTAGHA